MEEQRNTFNVGSPEYKKLDEELARKMAEFKLKMDRLRKDFMEREAKIYYQTYLEVSDAVKYYATASRHRHRDSLQRRQGRSESPRRRAPRDQQDGRLPESDRHHAGCARADQSRCRRQPRRRSVARSLPGSSILRAKRIDARMQLAGRSRCRPAAVKPIRSADLVRSHVSVTDATPLGSLLSMSVRALSTHGPPAGRR